MVNKGQKCHCHLKSPRSLQGSLYVLLSQGIVVFSTKVDVGQGIVVSSTKVDVEQGILVSSSFFPTFTWIFIRPPMGSRKKVFCIHKNLLRGEKPSMC